MNHPEEAADPTPAPAAGRARERFSTQVNPDVVARVRNAVVGVSQTTHSNYTLAQLTEDALQRQVRHLEEVYNDGKPWPAAVHELRRGRRIGAPHNPTPETGPSGAMD